ncbi:hypothetical protein K1719_016457 [Acacia pycnantha]|nr:hypothetical protein K1719_016457 [Acacia pycnantha]
MNAKWYYPAFQSVSAMVGAGVLSLPSALAALGWYVLYTHHNKNTIFKTLIDFLHSNKNRGPGMVVLILSWVITLYTLWQMVVMHEMVPGKRFGRYHELVQHAFGEKLGLWIMVPPQLMREIVVDIVFMVTGGKSLKKVHDLVCRNNCNNWKTTYFIMIFASVHFFLAHLPNFNSIPLVSLVIAIMSSSYSVIAWVASIHKGVQPDVSYGPKYSTTAGNTFGFLSALGDVAFSFAGHNVVLEIQATIPSTPEKKSKGPMWKGVVIAYIVVALCYFPVALIGYWIFGNGVADNILISLEKPTWLIVAANLFVVVHVTRSYQRDRPVFDMMATMLEKKCHFSRTCWKLEFWARNLYVALTMFVAITFPFAGAPLGFLGGFAFAPTSYYICIILGIMLTLLPPIGGLRNIIISAKTYGFYQ